MKLRHLRRVRSAFESPAARRQRFAAIRKLMFRRLAKDVSFFGLSGRQRPIPTQTGGVIKFQRINPFAAMPPPSDPGDPHGQRGFIPGDYRPTSVNLNAHWIEPKP